MSIKFICEETQGRSLRYDRDRISSLASLPKKDAEIAERLVELIREAKNNGEMKTDLFVRICDWLREYEEQALNNACSRCRQLWIAEEAVLHITK